MPEKGKVNAYGVPDQGDFAEKRIRTDRVGVSHKSYGVRSKIREGKGGIHLGRSQIRIGPVKEPLIGFGSLAFVLKIDFQGVAGRLGIKIGNDSIAANGYVVFEIPADD